MHLSHDMGQSQHTPLLVEPKFWLHSSHNIGLLMVEFLFGLVSIYNGRQGMKVIYLIHVQQWGVSPGVKLLFSDRCDPSAIAVLQWNFNLGSANSIVKDSKSLLFDASWGSSQETGNFNLIYFIFEREGRQANPKAHEAVDHRASFPSGREKISQLEIKPPTSSLRFGYLSTIIR